MKYCMKISSKLVAERGSLEGMGSVMSLTNLLNKEIQLY
jgi:hypothetical protein